MVVDCCSLFNGSLEGLFFRVSVCYMHQGMEPDLGDSLPQVPLPQFGIEISGCNGNRRVYKKQPLLFITPYPVSLLFIKHIINHASLFQEKKPCGRNKDTGAQYPPGKMNKNT